ncbi:MAG: Uma2 family endonuclease [Acidobacteria bacterium]|jgi:Uma2 family endonuclease|nr:Uma2 family endonuclease [Acidobacteriota bacterium]
MSAVLDLPKTTSISKIYKAVDIAREQQAAIILSNVAWETYNQFVEETMDKIVNPLFYYENENLLIMVKSSEHEFITDYIVLFINFVSVEWSINCGSLGSTTYRKDDIKRGFEPDSCFYFENEPKMRGVKRLDMSVHPAPDLIIEVDITSLSTFRQHIFAHFGVPEIWRFDGEQIEILKLENGKYVAVENSLALPLVTPEKLTEFIKESQTLSRLEWTNNVRTWARKIKVENE